VLVRSLAENWAEDLQDRADIEGTGKLDLMEVQPTGPGIHLAVARFALVVRACGQEFRLDLKGTGLDLWDLGHRLGGVSPRTRRIRRRRFPRGRPPVPVHPQLSHAVP
jgi:hypothetical protein